MSECSPDTTNGDFDRSESTEFSALGIHDIKSLLQIADYQGRMFTATGEERKEINGLFPGSGFSSLWSAGESEISPREGTISANEGTNFHAFSIGKEPKKPMEHDEQEMSGLKTFSSNQVKTLNEGPSDGETPESTTGTSNQNGGQKVSSTGRGPVSGLCQSKGRGRPNSAGSSGSGGDDGGDNRRPNVPTGSCQADGPSDVRNKKEKQKQGKEGENDEGDDEEDDDNDNKEDDDDNDSDDDGEKGAAEDEEEKENSLLQLNESPTDGTGHESHRIATSPTEVSAVDGAKKKSSDQGLKLDVESARRFIQAAVATIGPQVSWQPYLGDQLNLHCPEVLLFYKEQEKCLQKAFSCRHNMRAWDQCSEDSCRVIQQLLFHTRNCCMHVLGGCKVCIQHKNTLVFHASRCQLPTGKCVFEKCEDIRKYMEIYQLPDDKNWKYSHDQLFFTPTSPKTPTLLGSPVSRQIQRSLSHTHNCRKRVFGGCEVCTDYKDTMLAHASRCELPLGKCGIRRCSDIRMYMEANSLPDNGKWTRELDEFFFGTSPLATPSFTEDTEQGFQMSEKRFLNINCSTLSIAESSSLAAPSFTEDTEQGFQMSEKRFLNINRSTLPIAESSSFSTSGLWNQYHVDRPPDHLDLSANTDQPPESGLLVSAFPPSDLPVASDRQGDDTLPLLVSQDRLSDLPESAKEDQQSDLTVPRGPTADIKVTVHQNEESDQATTPISAVHVPSADQATRNSTPGQEVLWPLNKEYLSVDKDGCYLENVHWTRDTLIGGGSCGRCYLCTDVKTGNLFAIKRIPEDKFDMTELEIWGALSGRHPNILELYGAVKSQGKVTILMEYMEGGSVEDVGKIHETLALHIFWKVLSAVDFMHAEGIVHRDVKGANILIDETGEKVKLADFGTSIRLLNGYQQDDIPRGTEPFMSPEVCRSHPHSFSADIWSLMCWLYQMLKGTPPWEEYHHCHRLTLLYQIGAASRPPTSPTCSPEVEDLFSKGFQLEPSHRATARELLNHKVFVRAPDMSNMALPSYSTGYDPDYESSLSSLISSVAGSLISYEGVYGDDDNGDRYDAMDEEGSDDDDDDDDGADVDEESSTDDDDDDDDRNVDYAGWQIGAHGDQSQVIEAEAQHWQGHVLPGFEASSPEERLQSLQSDLFHSLPADELERMILNEITENSVTDNDINLITSQEDFDLHSLLDQISLDQNVSSHPDFSYSVSDLTKLHVRGSDGTTLFSIRERPTTTYGSLAKDLHGNIASLLRIDAFALTRDDGSPLDVHAEIGGQEQAVRVVRAHDTDSWQPCRWRVDVHGLVEQAPRG